jgi:hypothetical protein
VEEEEWQRLYEPPRVEDLGTLEEITGLGANVGVNEGLDLKT